MRLVGVLAGLTVGAVVLLSLDPARRRQPSRLRAAGPVLVRVATGVAGSLKDLALPDLMQILFHGRKSGKVSVKSAGREGQLHFQEGRMVHALLDEMAGEEAVYEMLTFAEGSFSLDPAFQPTTTTIQASPEMVILEGLRRLDEKNRDA